MTDSQLPSGLVLWPDDAGTDRRIAVLISDIHCTDCSVGNQTAEEADWKNFFCELEVVLDASISATSEILLILNGDVVDLLRSGKWADANVYPWQRDNPRFRQIVLDIMRDIVEKHTGHPGDDSDSSGFFHYLQDMVQSLRKKSARVTIIPTVGNHDKELQVVPEAREIYYRQCLGLSAADLGTGYRNWVAEQMGSDPDTVWPLLPFYVADPRLRLFATHGQWRDNMNSRTTARWKYCNGWQPQVWRQEQYQAFSDPCCGDTIASGLLSHFIWNATKAIKQVVIPRASERHQAEEINHILNVLREMDLYRPTARAVVRLLEETRKIDRSDENTKLLYNTVIGQYRNSLKSWLAHPETFQTAPVFFEFILYVISFLSRLHWAWLDTVLMRLMAWTSDLKIETPFAKLPAFLADYRRFGFRLHAEGHTHETMEVDLRYNSPREHRNYTYINLGAWRNRIVQKIDNLGYRRHSVGRAMIVHGSATTGSAESAYWFTLRDITSWGDKLDRW
jgi:UDP-2,3-diacylglucosamine pyrophosphatase LpxH